MEGKGKGTLWERLQKVVERFSGPLHEAVKAWSRDGQKGTRPRKLRAGANRGHARKAALRREARRRITKALIKTRVARGQDPRTGR